jgi:hypothetical protein
MFESLWTNMKEFIVFKDILDILKIIWINMKRSNR